MKCIYMNVYIAEVGTSNDPCSDIYRGPSAFSEPESVALANFILTIPNLKLYISLHAHGQFILYPYAYTSRNAYYSAAMVNMSG